MGARCQRMEEDLKLKNYAPATRSEHLRCAKRFVAHHMRSPAEMASTRSTTSCSVVKIQDWHPSGGPLSAVA